MDIQQLLSNGYQTNNNQKRDAGYGKYQYRVSDRSSLTLYGGLVDIWTNTPNTTNPTRAQVAEFGDNYLLDGTPFLANGAPDPYYYGYNTYHVQTDFEYAAYNADLGSGWKFDTKHTPRATGTNSSTRTVPRSTSVPPSRAASTSSTGIGMPATPRS
jgi:iron complex outermembrane recepter protein